MTEPVPGRRFEFSEPLPGLTRPLLPIAADPKGAATLDQAAQHASDAAQHAPDAAQHAPDAAQHAHTRDLELFAGG